MVIRRREDEDEEDEEITEADPKRQPNSDSDSDSDSKPNPEPEPEFESALGAEPEVKPEVKPEDELSGNDRDSALTPTPVSPVPRRRMQIPPSPEATAPSQTNAAMTTMPSDGIQEVITAMNKRFDKERADMKSFLEAFQAESRSEIKALKQAVDELKKVIEARDKQPQAPDIGASLPESDTRQDQEGASEADSEAVSGQTITSRLPTAEGEESTAPPQPTYPVCRDGKIILRLPPDWEPPMDAPIPGPKKSRLSVRGSKISRHPLMACSPPPSKSATERIMGRVAKNKGSDGVKNGL
ncbi:hypothetical protein Neosp_008971 [[Neocosmospora] mangrovei]